MKTEETSSRHGSMNFSPIGSAPLKPVSHDPHLRKRVLVEERVSCVGNLSHIVLAPGDTAVTHAHNDAHEVFYCIEGGVVFGVEGTEVTVRGGDCLVVEPEEEHSIERVLEETRLLYFFAFC